MPIKKAVTAGPSDYQVAVNNGFTGDPMEWQNSLQGAQKVIVGFNTPPLPWTIGDIWIIPVI
jgi:hypothetical protein